MQLCRDIGLKDPERVAEELFLMLEGARNSLQSVGAAGPGARFVGMVERFIDDELKRVR